MYCITAVDVAVRGYLGNLSETEELEKAKGLKHNKYFTQMDNENLNVVHLSKF